MAVAFKVAGNRTYHKGPYTSSSSTATPQPTYSVNGFWPRYEVMVMWNDETRKVIWGRKALKAWEVAMRMEGYKRWKKG